MGYDQMLSYIRVMEIDWYKRQVLLSQKTFMY